MIIGLIEGLTGGVLGLIFIFGMIYHAYKTEQYIWLTLMVMSWFIGLIILTTILFYFADMREDFNKGIGVYKD